MKPVVDVSVGRLAITALLWGILVTASACVGLILMRGWEVDGRTRELLLIVLAGAISGFCLARFLLMWLPQQWQTSQRFAAAFILIGGATVGTTALLFGLQFRLYFAQWHDSEWSKLFWNETIFTILSAVYQYLVLGLRLYIPLGLIGLIALSYGYAKRRI